MRDTAKLLFGDATILAWNCRQPAALADYKAVVGDIQSKLDAASSAIKSLDIAPAAEPYRKRLLEDLRIQAFVLKTEAKFFKTREAGVLLQRYEGLELKECLPAFAAVRGKPRFGAADWAKGRQALCKAGLQGACEAGLAAPPDPLCGFVGTDWFNCQLGGLRRRRGSEVAARDAEGLWAGIVRGETCGGSGDAD